MTETNATRPEGTVPALVGRAWAIVDAKGKIDLSSVASTKWGAIRAGVWSAFGHNEPASKERKWALKTMAEEGLSAIEVEIFRAPNATGERTACPKGTNDNT